jgi:hypothetical protein
MQFRFASKDRIVGLKSPTTLLDVGRTCNHDSTALTAIKINRYGFRMTL